MKLTFNNRRALVTGASRGIGKSIAEYFAAEGIEVICVSKSGCKDVAESIIANGGKATGYAVDVADGQAVQAIAEQILEKHGCIDILVNNAGITRDGLLLRMSIEDWDNVIHTNLSSCFYWVKALMRPMTQSRWGRIINITSVVGLMGNAGQTNYGAAKAGMIGFTKSLAREIASRNITVNAIAPGFISTDMTSDFSPDLAIKAKEMIPLKRFGKAEEVAGLTTYLASEEAGYITGKVFSIDGGLLM
jgi:3-oxoacyl-[acyl-carrier protein] reductase